MALVAGCSTSPATEATTAQTLPPELDSLLFPDGTWLADTALIRAAEETVLARCLERRGFNYPEPPRLLRDTPTDVITAYRIPSGADTYGLHHAARAVAATEIPPPAKAEEWQFALYGPANRQASIRLPSRVKVSFPLTGCLASAKQTLYGSSETAARVETEIPEFTTTLTEEVEQEPSYADALRRWQDCMAAAGTRAQSPQELIERLEVRYARDGVTPELVAEERALAAQDAHCDAETGLRAAYQRTATELVLGLSTSVRDHLSELGSAHAEAAHRARAFLAS